MSIIEELAESTRHVAEQVSPSVVRVGRDGGRGCGVILGDGRVVTNAHNLRGAEVTVTFADGRVEVASVAGAHVARAPAVLTAHTGEARSAPWTRGPARLGDVVFAVTRTTTGGTRVTAGQVSGTERAF